MRAAAVPIAIAASLLLAGCGSSKHAALTRYVKQVNAVESGLSVQLAQVATTNRDFAKGARINVLRPELARSQRTLGTLATKLAALDPPPEAKPLAATLARLVAVARSLVDEMVQFTVFIPAYRAALVPVARVSNAFRGAAHIAKTATAQAAAVETYAQGLTRPVAALAKLRPPAVLGPTFSTELRALRASRRTALGLAAALRARQTSRAHALVVRLAQIGVSTGSVSVQRAQIAAVRAYNAKVARVSQLQIAAQRQLVQLQRS